MRHLALFGLLAFACSCVAADEKKGVGQTFNKVKLTALDGKTVRLDKVQGQKATVVLFLSAECPVSNGYVPTLIELAKTYDKQGVAVIGVCETDEEADKIRKWIADYKFNFPVYVDPKQKTARGLLGECTPEAFVYDSMLKLCYRGRIDDLYNERFQKKARVTSYDLKDAIDAVLAGKEIKNPVIKAVGCPIPKEEKEITEPAEKVTYHRDVAPILQQHCLTCHRPGEVGPFALETYKQAKRWAGDIKTFTANQTMPPWMPSDGPGFRNERKLNAKEIEILTAWVDAGAPEGDVKDAPPPRKFADGWARGEPDLVLTPQETFHLGAKGKDLFRCFVLPLDIKDHQWVIGYDVKPGAPRVVHHTLHFYDGSGTGRKLEEAALKKLDKDAPDRGPGYPVAMGVGFSPPAYKFGELPKFGGVGGWAPGQMPQFLPEGAGMFLPKDSDFIMQVHYHRDGKPAEDRTQVGLYFAKKPIEQPWQTVIIEGMQKGESIPPGDKRYRSTGAVYLTTDVLLHNVMPHMHLLGKTIRVTLTPVEGKKQTLIAIDQWDYRWQDTYWFKEPILAKAGSKIEVEGIFDNSAANPNNPNDPPRAVTRGEETTNEMLFAFLGATSTKKPWQMIRFQRTPPPGIVRQAEVSEEMRILERRLGTWNCETTYNEAALTPKGNKLVGVETTTREMNGKFVQSKTRGDTGESLMLTTWDASRKAYRVWYYDSEGVMTEGNGQYDAKIGTLTWTSNPSEGVTSTTVWKFVDDDTFVWVMVMKDSKGTVLLDMKGKMIRKK